MNLFFKLKANQSVWMESLMGGKRVTERKIGLCDRNVSQVRKSQLL
jgi:hypothetical protein